MNDECGLLVDGFEHPPTLMMPHNPRYYVALLERAGFTKAKDLWVYQGGDEERYVPVPERLARGTELIRQRQGITLRALNMKDFEGEVERIKELYNAAWEKNWGFVPMTEHEIDHLAEQFKPVVIPGDGADRREGRQADRLRDRAAGPQRGLPHNRTGPAVSHAPAAALDAQDPKRSARARILLLGVLPEYQGKGIDAMLYHWIWTRCGEHGHLLGRSGLDPRGQPGDECRPGEDDFPGLQDLSAVRPRDMKALVTGATGFVGSHLVEALRRSGRRGDRAGPLAQQGRGARGRSGVTVVAGDLHDAAALAAGRGGSGRDLSTWPASWPPASEAEFPPGQPGRHQQPGRRRRARLATPVHSGVLAWRPAGPAPRGRPLDRQRAAPPGDRVWPQQARRRAGGHRQPRFPGRIVRPPMVYGPRDREVLKVFRLARLGIAPVFGDGSQQLSAVHGADLAAALVAVAATSGGAEGRIYYACHPEVFTSAEFVRAIGRARWDGGCTILRIPGADRSSATARLTEAAARLAGRPPILTTDKANEFFQPAWTGDPAPLTRDTGWRAAHDLERGLADT